MEEYRKRITNEADSIMESLPSRISHIDNILSQHFSTTVPSQISSQFASELGNTATQNQLMESILRVVRDEISLATDTMQKLERWIQLSVPKIEDGNNFGVEVQRSVLQQISASKVALQTAWDSLIDYNWQRATAFEKFAKKTTKESSQSTTKSESHGGKDGDEKKSNSNTNNKETITESLPIPDFISYIVALDVKWYFNLLRTTENIRDHYSFTCDVVKKNILKIRLPRGNQDRGGMSMF